MIMTMHDIQTAFLFFFGFEFQDRRMDTPPLMIPVGCYD